MYTFTSTVQAYSSCVMACAAFSMIVAGGSEAKKPAAMPVPPEPPDPSHAFVVSMEMDTPASGHTKYTKYTSYKCCHKNQHKTLIIFIPFYYFFEIWICEFFDCLKMVFEKVFLYV